MNGECKGRFPAKITAIGGLPAICGGAARSWKRARDGGGGEEATVKFDMWKWTLEMPQSGKPPSGDMRPLLGNLDQKIEHFLVEHWNRNETEPKNGRS